MRLLEGLGIAFIIFILISCLFEIILIGVAFFGADKVECNMLWCTFTTERSFGNDSIIIQTHRRCYLNGYEIDCNDNRTDLPIQVTDGNFDRQPITKEMKEWIDTLASNTGKVKKE